MGVLKPELLFKSTVPIIMAGILGIYGLIVSVILQGRSKQIKKFWSFQSHRRLHWINGLQASRLRTLLRFLFSRKCFEVADRRFRLLDSALESLETLECVPTPSKSRSSLPWFWSSSSPKLWACTEWSSPSSFPREAERVSYSNSNDYSNYLYIHSSSIK